MTTTTNQQLARAERLRAVMDQHRCWPFAHPNGAKMRDYDDAYDKLALYLGVAINDAGEEVAPASEPPEIPRYACVIGDETYDMIELSDTLTAGVDAVTGGIGNETLMNPYRIVDLDTGQDVPFHLIGLSEEAFTVLCGLVQPSWMAAETPEEEALAVNAAGIYTDCWDELRAKFPLAHFRKAAQERGEDFYHEEAGL
jgi:hypothetical protein